MTMMKTIGVRVRDHTGDLEAGMRLRRDRTIGQVRPSILETLNLLEEEVEENSESVAEGETYALYNDSDERRPYLGDTEIVGDVLEEGQTVRIVPEIIGGGSPS